MKTLLLILVVLVLVSSVAVAQDECWIGLEYSTSQMVYDGAQTPILLVLPNGEGEVLTAARLPDGSLVDATISASVRDCGGFPVVNYPLEDLWLESADGGLAICVGGSTPDANTDQNGWAHWTGSLAAGGASRAGLVVMISGSAITAPVLRLDVISPDLNGDLTVNLSDVPIFVSALVAGDVSRVDFNADGVINLSDIVIMGASMGAGCP